MKCKCSLEEKLDWRPCDVGAESWWCQVIWFSAKIANWDRPNWSKSVLAFYWKQSLNNGLI